MTPSAGASFPSIARWEKCGRAWIPSSVHVPGSIRRSSRSRAVSLSCSCWRAIFSSPPPSRALARRASSSSTSERIGGRATSVSAEARAGGCRSAVATEVGRATSHSTGLSPLPDRIPLLEERADALDDVLGREGERELRAQVVEGVEEGHVELAEHRVLAQAHDQRRLGRELERPLTHDVVEPG